MRVPDRLPDADDYGHHWLGADKTRCPVILKAGSSDKAPTNAHGYFASRGGTVGILFDGPRIRYFETASEALEALREV